MLDSCLFLLHGYIPPVNSASILLFIAIVLGVLISLELFVFGRHRRVKPGIPRVQSVCEDMRRKMSSSDQAAALEGDGLGERGVLPQQP